MSYILNLFVDQGSDWTHNAVMYTSNTSGRYTANMALFANGAGQIRKAVSSANSTANIVVSIHVANSSGIVKLSMNSTITGAMTHGRYLYDVEVIGALNSGEPGIIGATEDIERVVSGQIAITPQITKWNW